MIGENLVASRPQKHKVPVRHSSSSSVYHKTPLAVDVFKPYTYHTWIY